MPYSLKIIYGDLHRYLPGVFAVAFSALLIAFQCGLLLGLLSVASRPIDQAGADVWVGSRGVPSIGFSHPVQEAWQSRLSPEPQLCRVEPYLFGFGDWHKPDGGTEMCYVIGAHLEDGSLGAVSDLGPEVRVRLTEPGTIAVDESDLDNLGVSGVGAVAEIGQQRVRVVGVVKGVKTIGMMPGIYCSLRTARLLLPALGERPRHTMYLLACCRDPAQAEAVAQRLRQAYPDMACFSRTEFSRRTRMHWLTKTKAGIGLGFTTLLGFVVGALVTGQTLYAATAASWREFAVLRALGIPRWRVSCLVLLQGVWMWLAGLLLAAPATLGLKRLAAAGNLEVRMDDWIVLGTLALTLAMSLLSGLAALWSLRRAEPLALLR